MEEKHSEKPEETNNNVDNGDVDSAAQNDTKNEDEQNAEESQKEEKVDFRQQVDAMNDEELQTLFEKANESANYLDMLQRTKADYENYRKRQERDRATFLKYANQDILKQLLNVMDNLGRAIELGKQSEVDSNFFEGICLVQKELEKTLQDNHVKEIEAKGKAFNPNYHEAVSQIESADHPEMTVLEDFDRGYVYHDRVLRPSKVIVSKQPQVQEQKEENES
ncbi:nucleotide exchange factor GrpE [Candidatus Uabimicrobium amorphum]|uniref:Protein GrpE n=1 Tax=Uabimicrobium amorphum TaxID=2596890 RepID=A0A5S9F3W8_UABAM|nr:nucleotide exchange factor GrpE [Candidatus Uabimicrobium amorphum]BBM83854.1 protein GrpE [Candidatus Uabimicrobium amorphum]